MKGVITMKVNYNIQKEERKAMVAVVSKVLDTKSAYCGAPTFSYKIGAFEITKDGSLCFDDAIDEATVARVRTALREEGFMSEDGEDEASCADTGADELRWTESTVEEPTAVDAAEYKMWGNGVALPCVFYVLTGIAHFGHSVYTTESAC